jgi:hypothetical protein
MGAAIFFISGRLNCYIQNLNKKITQNEQKMKLLWIKNKEKKEEEDQ